MGQRVAEHRFRPRPFARPLRLRVDLHGVSLFPPRGDRTLIRWEWIEAIEVDDEWNIYPFHFSDGDN